MNQQCLPEFLSSGMRVCAAEDPELYALLVDEYCRQLRTLTLVASCSIADPSVLACEACPAVNVTAEGYPGKRYHAGCEVIDQIESLAIDRACRAFDARYANVQPHSASSANMSVLCSLLQPGDRILGMQLDAGGHLSHGAPASLSGRYFEVASYGLTPEGLVDYDEVLKLAKEFRPKLIICGATAHSRTLDFARFRSIADEAAALLLADVTHIAGLVAAGVHPSPIDHAHVTTTCTHKQLYGPRGGLILIGKEWTTRVPGLGRTLAEVMQSAVFPLMQGAPVPNNIAAKARALARVLHPSFRTTAEAIVSNARRLALRFSDMGHVVVSGGTDTHIVLLDLRKTDLTGITAQNALESSGIIVNKNKIPGDVRSVRVASGIRLGTNGVTVRGMRGPSMDQCANLIDTILRSTSARGEDGYSVNPAIQSGVRSRVADLCAEFPPPNYALPLAAASH